jgi:hypothetical protein
MQLGLVVGSEIRPHKEIKIPANLGPVSIPFALPRFWQVKKQRWDNSDLLASGNRRFPFCKCTFPKVSIVLGINQVSSHVE